MEPAPSMRILGEVGSATNPGTVYKIGFLPQGNIFSCTCADWLYRKSKTGEPCRHIETFFEGALERRNRLSIPRREVKHVLDQMRHNLTGLAWITPVGAYRRGDDWLEGAEIVAVLRGEAEAFYAVLQAMFGEPITGGKKNRDDSWSKNAEYTFTTVFPNENHPRTVRIKVHTSGLAQLGGMLLHLTGPEDFVVKMHSIALSRGKALTQYGLLERGSDAAAEELTERGIFNALGVEYLPPALRS